MIESPKIARFRLMDGTGKYSPRSEGKERRYSQSKSPLAALIA